MYQAVSLQTPEQSEVHCFHCGQPVIRGSQFSQIGHTGRRVFCCPGCLAIASFIEQGGLARYYSLRDTHGNKPDEQENSDFEVYDNDNLQSAWIKKENGRSHAEFLVEGLNCSACIWLIESWLSRLPGIDSVNLNYSTQRLSLEWLTEEVKVSEILGQIQGIGYKAYPYTREARFALLEKRKSTLLKQLGVAAALGMQIMMISVALYSGDWFGIEPNIESFLRKVNLLLVIPLLAYSARSFLTGAWTSIRTLRPSMDLSISLGIGLAFAGSFWATVSNQGDVYYDSIAMFVFFLLGARYLETSSRLKGSLMMEPLASVVPLTAIRVREDEDGVGTQSVAVVELKAGDHVIVKPGEVVPVDGELVKGRSGFDESMLTGEFRPLVRVAGSKVLAGSINIDQVVTIKATALRDQTMLSSILELADRANFSKPRITQYVEKVSGWFVLAIIVIAGMVAGNGIWTGNEQWLPITISVLVVTCPCALALATPLALVAGANDLMRHGVYIVGSGALETLNKINHIVFDKTGTLTRGTPELDQISILADKDAAQCLEIAASLEYGSSHPIAKSLLKAAAEIELIPIRQEKNIPGCGVEGRLDHLRYCLGSMDFVKSWSQQFACWNFDQEGWRSLAHEIKQMVVLGSEKGLIASFTFSDVIRDGAQSLVAGLHANKVSTSLISGDRKLPVQAVAGKLGIKNVYANCLPEEKLRVLDQLIDKGDIVAMVGDGINDTPAMNGAHLSIAMARDINLASANADIVVTNSRLTALAAARSVARKTYAIIRQNIWWAIFYNASAIPAALAGWVPPWLAGIGMSISSVLVVLNAGRISSGPSLISQNK